MEGRDLLEAAGRDQGRGGVAQDRQQDLQQGAAVAAGEVRQGEDRDPGEAQGQARHAAGAEVFGVAEEPGQDDADDRHARDQQARRRAGQVPFGVGEGEPGDHDLQDREGQQRAPVGPYRGAEAALPQGERQQQERAERAPREDHHRRGHRVHRHLDHQIGDAPDHSHQGEQEPAACSHAAECRPHGLRLS
nr:hypothetical protein [Streptomyces sp. NRRL B-3648]